MKYTVTVQKPLFLEIEIETDDIGDARDEALKIAKSAPMEHFDADSELEIYETAWTDADGIHIIL